MNWTQKCFTPFSAHFDPQNGVYYLYKDGVIDFSMKYLTNFISISGPADCDPLKVMTLGYLQGSKVSIHEESTGERGVKMSQNKRRKLKKRNVEIFENSRASADVRSNSDDEEDDIKIFDDESSSERSSSSSEELSLSSSSDDESSSEDQKKRHRKKSRSDEPEYEWSESISSYSFNDCDRKDENSPSDKKFRMIYNSEGNSVWYTIIEPSKWWKWTYQGHDHVIVNGYYYHWVHRTEKRRGFYRRDPIQEK